MKKSERIGAIIKILTDNPNKLIKLTYFCEELNAAKSSISEDISVAKEVMTTLSLGKIITISGAEGGVKYVPIINEERFKQIQNNLIEKLNDPSRYVGGGFLYTSDIMFDPEYIKQMASYFATYFKDSGAECVVTLETKGIPLAFLTASLLNIPSVVLRRESRISDGPTVSINYFSGSAERIQKMSLSKKAVQNFKKALIIDDFMRAGGSLKGIEEMLMEFDITVVGIGVAITTLAPKKKKVNDYVSIIYYDDAESSGKDLIFHKELPDTI